MDNYTRPWTYPAWWKTAMQTLSSSSARPAQGQHSQQGGAGAAMASRRSNSCFAKAQLQGPQRIDGQLKPHHARPEDAPFRAVSTYCGASSPTRRTQGQIPVVVLTSSAEEQRHRHGELQARRQQLPGQTRGVFARFHRCRHQSYRTLLGGHEPDFPHRCSGIMTASETQTGIRMLMVEDRRRGCGAAARGR